MNKEFGKVWLMNLMSDLMNIGVNDLSMNEDKINECFCIKLLVWKVWFCMIV